MKTIDKELPKRFTEAVTKLYNAFHNGELNPFDCKACAVGNICDNTSVWDNYLGHCVTVNQHDVIKSIYESNDGKILPYSNNGYNQTELHTIEKVFLSKWIDKKHNGDRFNKELQFKGLCAVISYLCELDNIPNIMDYQSLFETNEKSEPKKQLNF